MDPKAKRKGFIDSFSEFISNPEDLTQDEIIAELQEEGIDIALLENRVAEIIKKGSAERRLAWQRKAKERREEIEKILKSKQPAGVAQDLISNINDILKGSYGQEALSRHQCCDHARCHAAPEAGLTPQPQPRPSARVAGRHREGDGEGPRQALSRRYSDED